MAERVQQLTDMANKRAVLRFNANRFKDFVKSTPRNYSVVIMFTAMAPQRQCQVCRHASDEFTIVANSFRYSQAYSNKLYFAVVDFDEGSDVFQMVSILFSEMFISIINCLCTVKVEYSSSFYTFPSKRKTKDCRYHGHSEDRFCS